MTSLTVPGNYGYVVLGVCVLPMIASTLLGGEVMKARKAFDVQYPNLYATPGYHKKADEFNRVQRGHQSMFELMTSFTACGLIGGLKHPLLAAGAGVLFSVGNYLFLLGYADTSLDVKVARYKKGGPLKMVGVLMAFGTAISSAGSMNGWW
jgi:glutathione S-transferase